MESGRAAHPLPGQPGRDVRGARAGGSARRAGEALTRLHGSGLQRSWGSVLTHRSRGSQVDPLQGIPVHRMKEHHPRFRYAVPFPEANAGLSYSEDASNSGGAAERVDDLSGGLVHASLLRHANF